MKKIRFRFLSIFLCFMFVFFVGCDGGNEEDFENPENPGESSSSNDPKSLDGAKVLSKPSQYSISDAVGVNASEYFYNKYAFELFDAIYKVYVDYANNDRTANCIKSIKDKNNGVENLNLEVFLRDSLRFTIDRVYTTYEDIVDKNTQATKKEIFSQKLILNLSSSWNWGINYQGNGNKRDITFKNMGLEIKENAGELEVKFNTRNDWKNIYNTSLDYIDIRTNYLDIYNFNLGSSDVVYSDKYAVSPYTQTKIDKVPVTALNYYQDALEYAIYLFVLGYDYKDETAKPTPEADKFDFVISKDSFPSNPQDLIKVKGWGQEPISVVDALDKVKNLYKKQGGYIGLTAKNRTQIKDFVLDKIIGKNAIEKESFTVKNYEGTKPETGNVVFEEVANGEININRNYEEVITEMVNYLCKEVPIGKKDNGEIVTLDEPYLISQITEYKGDYFFLKYENDKGENDDSNLFGHIASAEYQNIILYPTQEFMNKKLTDIWLAFEYYDNPNDEVMLDALNINVGFRFFSSKADGGKGKILCSAEVQKKVKKGQNGEVGDKPDENWVYMGNGKDTSFYELLISDDVVITQKFNKNIGNGVINPFVSGTNIGPVKTKTITGLDDARKYYKLNESSSYGHFGTLNESMFSVENAGADACDFIEVYFDIVKDKGESSANINYNFKVGLVTVAYEEEV